MKWGFEGARLHHRRARLHDLDRAAANLLLTLQQPSTTAGPKRLSWSSCKVNANRLQDRRSGGGPPTSKKCWTTGSRPADRRRDSSRAPADPPSSLCATAAPLQKTVQTVHPLAERNPRARKRSWAESDEMTGVSDAKATGRLKRIDGCSSLSSPTSRGYLFQRNSIGQRKAFATQLRMCCAKQ
jgi:hypothetical protein